MKKRTPRDLEADADYLLALHASPEEREKAKRKEKRRDKWTKHFESFRASNQWAVTK